MNIQNGSVHHQILERLCAMPKAVRGISAAMLQRQFGESGAIDDLVAAGLVRSRGWADGPGAVLVPTVSGEALAKELRVPHRETSRSPSDRVILPQRSS